MNVGYVHDEFGYSWALTEAYPYTHPKAYFGRTRQIHGTVHYLPLVVKGDKLPFNIEFDYSPYDMVIFFLQGGRCQKDVEYMRHIKEKYPDTLLVLWWGEIYRLDQDAKLMFTHVLKAESELLKTMDLLVSPFHVYETDVAPVVKEMFDIPYRTINPPYDTHHIKKHHSKTEGNFDGGVWTMVHGRAKDITRSLTVMGLLQKEHGIRCLVNPHNYMPPAEVLKCRDRVAPDLEIEFTPVYDPHDVFMDHLKEYLFIFDDYPAICASNLSICAATCGVPTISHTMNTSNTLCFPELTFGMNDLQSWYRGAERLIYDVDFYKETMIRAQLMAEKHYSFNAVRERIKNIYEEFKC